MIIVLAASTASAQTTTLTINPASQGAPYVARYSQAVLIDVLLSDNDGPLVGEQMIIEAQAEGSDDVVTLLPGPTDGMGRALARLTLVNGRHGGATFPAAEITPQSEGLRYEIRARFAGDLDADDPLCAADAGTPDLDAGTPDLDAGPLGLCPSSAVGELFVSLETVSLELEPGNIAILGDEMTLIATLFDVNGDAPVAGTTIDGDEAKALSGANISFFFDLDGNERPSADERLGISATGETGIAVLTYTVDPAIFPAGEQAQGLHVQFGGDDSYAVAGASGRVTIEAGGPDASRSVIELEPEDAELIANGTAQLTLVGILVDEANNILGVDAPENEVRFTTDLGTVLLESAERDVLNGRYTQTLRVPEQGGPATIQIIVNGDLGATRVLMFESQGCACTSATETPPLALGLLVLVGGLARRQRRRRAPSTPSTPVP